MSHLFISYVREDHGVVAHIAESLRTRGYDVWWDREILSGTAFRDVIEQKLESAAAVIVVWSRLSVKSSWVRDEAQVGLDRDRLFPLLLDPETRPPLGFRELHMIDCSSSTAGALSNDRLDELCAALLAKGILPSPKPAQATAQPVPPAATVATAPKDDHGGGGQQRQSSWPLWLRYGLPGLALAAVLALALANPWQGGQVAPPAPSAEICADCAEVTVKPDGTAMIGEAPLAAGRQFRECPRCPLMVAVPMAAPPPDRSGEAVATGLSAIGKFEVTFDEWDACYAAGGCPHHPDAGNWGRGSRPVINVSWLDAKTYVAWLSESTGKNYRLLREAEWARAARGSGESSAAPAEGANCEECGGEWQGKRTAPVGSFAANSHKLHDMIGNVAEWVEECWSDTEIAATGPAAWPFDCGRHVVRGGTWYTPREHATTQLRYGIPSSLRAAGIGFRVARSLSHQP